MSSAVFLEAISLTELASQNFGGPRVATTECELRVGQRSEYDRVSPLEDQESMGGRPAWPREGAMYKVDRVSMTTNPVRHGCHIIEIERRLESEVCMRDPAETSVHDHDVGPRCTPLSMPPCTVMSSHRPVARTCSSFWR
jgi:hypothetical protein